MIYQAFQAYSDMLEGVQALARVAAAAGQPWRRPLPGLPENLVGLNVTAGFELLAQTRITTERPPFGIETVRVGEQLLEVHEEAAHVTPFATLLHFRKPGAPAQPRVLVVAPMSGHFATLLRSTVRTLLSEHDVYITDWHNARDVALRHGRFDLNSFVEHLVGFLDVIGPGAHLLGVCQPCVAALAATALMAEDDHPAAPRSLTLMAGPIDTRSSPTKVNEFAKSKPIGWFEKNVVATVPLRYGGALRKVYPGFLQLTAFMSMNMDRHVKAHFDLFDSIVAGDEAKAGEIRKFYDEYFAVMDLPAEFYLETVKAVFQDHDLPLGRLQLKGRRIDPAAIRRTALLTVEGERDDICGIGQTVAAQDLCTGIRPYMKKHHVQAGAGHYGVFSGRRWEREVYPMVRNIIHATD
jgi:polyhydroxyalkanoate depolymerase